MVRLGSRPSSFLEIVVLPAPDGEERTSISPRRLTSMKPDDAGAVIVLESSSLDVLDLLAQLLDRRLQVDPDTGEADIGALGAERIGLAVEFLAEEVELAPDRAALGHQIARRRNMGVEPVQLLAHIRLAGENRGFLRQTVLVQRRQALQQFGELLLHLLPNRQRLGAGTLRRRLAEALNLVHMRGDEIGEALAFDLAHLGEAVDRLAEALLQGFGALGGFRF